MEPGPVLLSGWLMKKRQENKLGIGSKYQKRFFELTAIDLAYCKDIKDKNAEVEVFNMRELKSLRRAGDTKIEMSFPERLLVVKAPTPGETDRWLQGLDRVYKDTRHTPGSTNSDVRIAEPYMRPQTTPTTLTIEADSSDDEEPRQQPPPKPAPSRSASSRPPPLMPPPDLDRNLSAGRQNPRSDNRPPSPRSLLANPKLGTMMVASPTQRVPSADRADEHEAVQEWVPDQDSDSEDERRRQRAQRPKEETIVLEPPRSQPASLNSSLRNAPSMSRAYPKDEVLELSPAPAAAERMGSARHGPNGLASQHSLGRSPSGAARSGSLTRSNPKEEMLVLDAPKHQQAAGSRGSTASSSYRHSNGPRNPGAEERIELQPPVVGSRGNSRAGSATKATVGTGVRAGSAGSAHGVVTGASTRAQSAASSQLGPNLSSAMGGDSDHVEGDWDNWDSDPDGDDDSAMNQTRGQGSAGKGGAGKGVQRQAVIQEGFHDEDEGATAAAPRPPSTRKPQQPAAPSLAPPSRAARPPPHPASKHAPAAPQRRSSWDEDDDEEEEKPRVAVQAPRGKETQPRVAAAGLAGVGRLEDSDELQNRQAQGQGASNWDDWDD